MPRHLLFAVGIFAVGISGAFGQCTIDPAKDFFQNFDNSCYAFTIAESAGSDLAGDANALYGLVYFKVNPGYELIVFGTFRQARYFSIGVNDDHVALTSSIYDQRIQPLTAADQNPYQTGATYQPGQRYAVSVSLGGTEPPAEAILPGCSAAAYNIHGNSLSGYLRHTGIDWNGDPSVPPGFPAHKGTPPVAGTVMTRTYMPEGNPAPPVKFLVRDLKTGCAVNVNAARGELQLVTMDPSTGRSWNDTNQVAAHQQYATSIQPRLCFARVTNSALVWQRNEQYVPGINPNAAYLNAQVPAAMLAQLTDPGSDMVLRIRLRLPTTATLPCAGCALNGTEQLRYWSIAFLNHAETLGTVNDTRVVKDSNGYATIVLSIGKQQPVNATAGNGYTYISLSAAEGAGLSGINMRSILSAQGFSCSSNVIPFRTTEDNPAGGYMGDYAPIADVIAAADLPAFAAPLMLPNTCDVQPGVQPESCQVFYPQ